MSTSRASWGDHVLAGATQVLKSGGSFLWLEGGELALANVWRHWRRRSLCSPTRLAGRCMTPKSESAANAPCFSRSVEMCDVLTAKFHPHPKMCVRQPSPLLPEKAAGVPFSKRSQRFLHSITDTSLLGQLGPCLHCLVHPKLVAGDPYSITCADCVRVLSAASHQHMKELEPAWRRQEPCVAEWGTRVSSGAS